MDNGKQAGSHHGKNRHGLGAAGNGRPPARPKEKEHRRNQGARVGNPDPEHEIGDIHAPADRMSQPGHAQSRIDLIDPAIQAKGQHHQVAAEQGIPDPRWRAEQVVEQVAIDLKIAEAGRHEIVFSAAAYRGGLF